MLWLTEMLFQFKTVIDSSTKHENGSENPGNKTYTNLDKQNEMAVLIQNHCHQKLAS